MAVRKGEMRAPSPTTLTEAGMAWLDGARAGTITTRSGDLYKPSAIRTYEAALRLRVLPAIGDVKITDLRRTDLQDLVDALRADKLAPATIQVTLLPLRAIYRRELARGRVSVNPTTGLELPAVRGGRDRIADPAEAAALIAALPAEVRPLWATAMYAGLRRGELRAIRWEDVDLAAGVLHVQRGWDQVEGEIETKGRNRRRVPIPAVLRDHLVDHRLRGGEGLVFGISPISPFRTKAVSDQADAAWKAAGMHRITMHEARHSYASLMIAAGVNAKALSTYMGHANISITLDRYGHLMPGNEGEAAGMLDAYLDRADARAREADPHATVPQTVP